MITYFLQLVMVLAVAACASAQYLGPVAFRAPSHDSAIIQNHRLGGNFAYSTHEAHAYGINTPIIGTRTVPIGVSYVPGTPIVKSSTHVLTHRVPQVNVGYPQVAYPYGAGIPYPYAFPQVVDTTAAKEPAVEAA